SRRVRFGQARAEVLRPRRARSWAVATRVAIAESRTAARAGSARAAARRSSHAERNAPPARATDPSHRGVTGGHMNNRVYRQTDGGEGNGVIAFDRLAGGRLPPLGTYETGGRGTGKPHLASQSSVVLSEDGAWLLVANPGSDELSLFAVEPDGL